MRLCAGYKSWLDEPKWKLTGSRKFTIASCYERLRRKAHAKAWCRGVWYGELTCLAMLLLHAWLTLLNGLKTKDVLIKRGLQIEPCSFLVLLPRGRDVGDGLVEGYEEEVDYVRPSRVHLLIS